MSKAPVVLILEDEPFIMLDLELAGQDLGCTVHSTGHCKGAFALIEEHDDIDVAVLDVTLEAGETCLPIAKALSSRGVPYLLHTGDLVQEDGTVRGMDAPTVPKPAPAHDVIEAALDLISDASGADRRYAAQ